MTDRSWYRAQLAGLCDQDLGARALSLLRCEWMSGEEYWQTDECWFECDRRGRGEMFTAARDQVARERQEWRENNVWRGLEP